MTPEHFQCSCPHCQQSLRVRREFVGKRAACKHCGQAFTITAPAGEAPEGAPAPSADEIAALKANVIRLEVERGQFERDAETAREQLRILQLEVEPLRKEAARVRSLNGELEALRLDHERLQKVVSALTAERDDLKAELEELRESVAKRSEEERSAGRSLEEELATLRKEREDERSAWASERERLERAASEASDSASKTLEELRSRAQSATELADDLAKRVEEAATERDQARKELHDRASDMEFLRSQVREAHQFREEMRVFLGGLGIKLPT